MPRGVKAKPSVSIDGNDIVNTGNDLNADITTDTALTDEITATKSDTNAMPVSQEKPKDTKPQTVKDYVFTTRTMIGDKIYEENEKCSIKGEELETLMNSKLVKPYQPKKYVYTQNYWKDSEKYNVGDEFTGSIIERNILKKQGIIEER